MTIKLNALTKALKRGYDCSHEEIGAQRVEDSYPHGI
jgi:hypothetical protein